MKKQIYGQNIRTLEDVKLRDGKKIQFIRARVITTNTRLFIYQGAKLIGQAGVSRAADFDYEALFKIAQHQPSQDFAVV